MSKYTGNESNQGLRESLILEKMNKDRDKEKKRKKKRNRFEHNQVITDTKSMDRDRTGPIIDRSCLEDLRSAIRY